MYNDYLERKRMNRDYRYNRDSRDYRYNRDYREDMYNDNYRDGHMPYDNYVLKSGYYDREQRYHPYEYERDRREYDGNDEWEKDIKEWCNELKRYDIFNLTKEEIIKKAKEMNVKFDNFDENEFITTYYMLISDFPNVATSPQFYLSLAKMWLNDKDVKLKGSSKLCAYYYTIVKGE